MLGFTKQEQGIILFLIFTLAVGSGVRLYERLAPEEPVVNASTDFIEKFNTISHRLNVASDEPSPTQFYESGQSKIALNPTLPLLTPPKIASKKKNAIVKNKGQLKININSSLRICFHFAPFNLYVSYFYSKSHTSRSASIVTRAENLQYTMTVTSSCRGVENSMDNVLVPSLLEEKNHYLVGPVAT